MKSKKRKELKKARAEKKIKRKKIITITICASVVVVITALFILNYHQSKTDRIFTEGHDHGHQTITLHGDGTFTANLAHDRKKGTYTEKTESGITIVYFTFEGTTVNGNIENNILSLPEEWDDHHGHGNRLRLK